MHQVSKGIALLLCLVFTAPAMAVTVSKAPRQWQPVELQVTGPQSHELAESPNPFLDIRLDVILISPTGTVHVVPGFFAGDGHGGGSGDQWKARFTPDEPGEWRFEVQLQQGDALAVADSNTPGTPLPAHGDSGVFPVAEKDSAAPGFLAKGPLRYVGEHYLRFADDTYWIKGGIDSPENFLAFEGFDNTVKQAGGVRPASLTNMLHGYRPHIEHWLPGDPLFRSVDTGIDSKGIIGAVNYLSSQGVNSLYMLMMNLGGDGRDTYPFVGASGSVFDNTHYDISKLHQWNIVLGHMQRRSIALHLVLGEQESDNTAWLDEGQLGTQRKLYYRELVARFSYLNALKWNLSEESRYTDEQHLAFARYLRSIDPATHPIAVHHWVDRPAEQYEPLLGDTDFDATSIQFHPDRADEFTEIWRRKTREAGKPWVVDMDEQGPGNLGLSVENMDELRKSVLYPVYFSGGNIEWYFGRYSGDIGTEDFRTYEPMYHYMRYARQLLLEHVPFHRMEPSDSALSGGHVLDQVFELPGQTYLLYLQDGREGRALSLSDGVYRLRWFNPRNGQFSAMAGTVTGGTLSLETAPIDLDEDWVVMLDRVPPEESEPDATAPQLGAATSEEDASVDGNPLGPVGQSEITETVPDVSDGTVTSSDGSSTRMDASAVGSTGVILLNLLLVVTMRRSGIIPDPATVQSGLTTTHYHR